MEILSTKPHGNFLPYHPSFRNWERQVVRTEYPERIMDIYSSKMHNIKHKTTTGFFKDNNHIPDILDYSVEKSKNVNHVNFYCYGCSNCSETYSILMYLISKYGEDIARKFTPIVARDYDEVAISQAQRGILPINKREYERIQKYTKGKFEEFFLPNRQIHYFSENENIEVPVNPKYYSMIDIQKADIRDDYINIPPKNTILTTMNFLPYLPHEDYCKLIKNIANHLEGGSLWGFGTFDMGYQHYTMDKFGFSNKNRPYGLYEKLPFTTIEGLTLKVRNLINRVTY